MLAIDLAGPVADLDLAGFDGAMVVVMRGGRPLGRFTTRAAGHGPDRVLPGTALADRARAALWHEIWADELAERLRRRLGTPEPAALPRLGVTVAVCTRDRPEHLAECLRTLAALDPPPERVLVIDNASRRPCRALVEAAGADYAEERTPGLDWARNRALALCATPLIAFTDDDCRPVPGWLAPLHRHFADLATGAVTGWGAAARLDSDAQIAFEETGGFTRGWRVSRFDWETLDPTSAGRTGAGANMAFRADVLRAVGGFPPELDAGTPTASGGDIYALGRVLAAGWRVVFDPASLVWHDHRADVPELRRVMRGYGRGIGSGSSRFLVVDREPRALAAYAWPFRNLRSAAGAVARRRGSLLGLLAASEQARGTLEGPVVWARSLRAVPSRPIGRGGGEAGAAAAGAVPASPPNRRRRAPELSVVVPTLPARGPALRRCLAALAAQTLARGRYEVIVVPNGPDAGAVRAVPGADRVVRVAAPGAAGARNAGAEAARAPRLVFLDDDILAAPGCLEAHLARAGADGDGGAVLGPAFPAEPLRTLAEQASGRWWLDHYSRKHRPGHRFTFVDCLTGNLGLPRERFLAVGGLDAAFGPHRREDWELGCRLLGAGVPFTAAPEAVAHHHHAPTATRLLGDARREGYGDVLLAARHPATSTDLRLTRGSDVATGGVGRQGWRLDVALGRAATGRGAEAVALSLAALERARRREAWSARLGALLRASYRAGVQSALDDGHRVPDAPPTRTWVDLDADEPLAVGMAIGEVVLRVSGRELGQVRAPDGQWDADAIIERLVEQLGLPALAARAGSGRG